MRVILNMSLMSSPPCKECPLKPLRAEVFTSTTEKMVLPGLTMHPNYTYDGCFPHVCLELFLPSKPYKFTGKERDSESGRVARRINPKTTLGALPSVFEGGAFDFAISPSSLMCRSHSARLIAARPSFSTTRCTAPGRLAGDGCSFERTRACPRPIHDVHSHFRNSHRAVPRLNNFWDRIPPPMVSLLVYQE